MSNYYGNNRLVDERLRLYSADLANPIPLFPPSYGSHLSLRDIPSGVSFMCNKEDFQINFPAGTMWDYTVNFSGYADRRFRLTPFFAGPQLYKTRYFFSDPPLGLSGVYTGGGGFVSLLTGDSIWDGTMQWDSTVGFPRLAWLGPYRLFHLNRIAGDYIIGGQTKWQVSYLSRFRCYATDLSTYEDTNLAIEWNQSTPDRDPRNGGPYVFRGISLFVVSGGLAQAPLSIFYVQNIVPPNITVT